MSLECVVEEAGRPVVPPPVSRARPPRTSWDVVERPRLLHWITSSVDRLPLTLICAPAGTGKTVLAADWACRQADDGRPVAWLTMTERDNHPGVFWTHFQLALATIGALTDGATRPMFPDAADVDALSDQVLELTVPVVLVIDAAERLRSRVVHDQLRNLVDAAGERIRLVMAGRVEPPLPVHRYRVENRVAEIRADDLALDRKDVDQVLLRHRLSTERSAEIVRRTEGWPAGVRLAALQLVTHGPDADLDGFATEYVRAEIVASLTSDEREVLTATSVVEELPPGLAPGMTGRADADDLLRTMSSGNAFVLPVRRRTDGFRLHPLVREPLRADLDRDAPERAAVLHHRAAAWFDERGRLEPAVRHLAAAGDWPAAAARVVAGRGIAEVVVGTTIGDALVQDLAAIPDTGSSDVAVLRAAIALRVGDLDRARTTLDRAATHRGVAPSLVRTAWHDAAGQGAETLAAAREARARLADVEAPDPFVAAVVATAEGAAQLREGDLEAASATLGEAVSVTTGSDNPLRLRCVAEMALVEACAGRLTRAIDLADDADRSAANQGVPPASRPVALELARAWVALERQELPSAQRSLDRVNRRLGSRDDEMWQATTLLLRGRYLRDRGDLRGARRQLDQVGTAPGWLRDHVAAEVHALEAAEHRPGPWPMPGECRRVRELLENADRSCRAGDLTTARADVGRALNLGRTERLRRPFAHASPRIWSLIRSDAQMHARAGWLRPGELAGTDGAAPPAEPVLETLTARELEVLRHLAAFLTTEEVAAAMYISVNTVRTHVRRVLEKLSVSRRNEAVRRGQELGLV